MKNVLRSLGVIAVLAVIGFIYYYIALPPINIHSVGLWIFLILLIIGVCAIYVGLTREKANRRIMQSAVTIVAALIIVFLVGSLLSSTIFNAKKYQKLLTVDERNFTEDIKQISYNEIPILDKASAQKLGDRKMGTMVEMVSQFEVSNLYTQINYQGVPVRVTPLKYGSIIKWFTNRDTGIPAYITIDMATQDVTVVKLKDGMKYSTAEHFSRNVYRHLRFAYPTYIFDSVNFEIDDDGVPYWICPVKKYNIGLFGGTTVGRVVMMNAITGEMKDYAVEDVPTWVDRVYSADMLVKLYDYYGGLKHGFFNSILGQKDSLMTTEGYNYIALEDDVWVYTGVTSVGQDQSNVGFVLMNQRTMETRYYIIPGATEVSAMNSAEGQVQHLKYEATFPLLLNIAGEPTYFIALKDDAGLVKMYAMVNVAKYQIVATGDTVIECEKAYIELMKNNGIDEVESDNIKTIEGAISKISQAVISGNSHYYIMVEGSDEIFDISVTDFVDIIRYNVGDTISLEYAVGDSVNQVTAIK